MTYADPADQSRDDRPADARFADAPRPPLRWGWLVGLGALSVLVGVVAILAPFASSIAVSIWIGAAFVVAGVAAVAHAFADAGWKLRLAHAGTGAVYLIGGALVAFQPLASLIAFSVVVAAMMIVSGVWRTAEGLRLKPEAGWGWMTATGALMGLLGVAVSLGFPGSAFWLLGTLVGAGLIAEGAGLLVLGAAARRAAKTGA